MDPENIFEKMKKTPEDIITLQMCSINDSHMMDGSRDTECNGQIFFVILDCFLPFCPPNNPKNQNFQKMKTPHGDIITFHRCNINKNHIMYDS